MIHYENKLNDLFCFRRSTWIIQETSSSSFTPNFFSFLPWRPLQNSEWFTLTSSPTHPVHQGALCSCTGGGALWRESVGNSVGSLIFSFQILLCLRPHAELKALRLGSSSASQNVSLFDRIWCWLVPAPTDQSARRQRRLAGQSRQSLLVSVQSDEASLGFCWCCSGDGTKRVASCTPDSGASQEAPPPVCLLPLDR